jgi:hypothetical protein
MGHPPPQCCKIMPPHHAKYDGRIHWLQQYSGPHRGLGHVAYESESDSESDWRGNPPTIASRSNQQRHPHLIQNDQNASTAHCFAQVSQATPSKDIQALRGSRSSGPLRESSGARSGPLSPWRSREKKKRIIDALRNELSDIHLFIGDETTTSCAVKYAKI